MHIAVNTQILVGNRLDGIGIFTRETVKRIVRAHPEHQFTFLFMRPVEPEYVFAENVTPLRFGPTVREPLFHLIRQEFQVPPILRRIGADLYFSPEPTHSLRADIPTVTVVHDINFEHHPDVLPWYWRLYYRHFARRHAMAADRIATVSEYSKRDLVETWGIDPDRIDVVYNGAPERLPLPDEQELERIRQRISGGAPYFYFVGTLQQRKNIAGMLRAFDLFRSGTAGVTKLVIAGRRKWWTREMEDALNGMTYREDVIFIGRIPDHELFELAAASLALLYVPFFEGFGIPILEAWRAGVPVITSNVTSMPEVAGDAALLVDPYSPEEIAAAMRRLAGNPSLRSDLITRGNTRSDLFSWDRTAELMWKCIERELRI